LFLTSVSRLWRWVQESCTPTFLFFLFHFLRVPIVRTASTLDASWLSAATYHAIVSIFEGKYLLDLSEVCKQCSILSWAYNRKMCRRTFRSSVGELLYQME
jgi:hypothetical protein